MDFLFGINIWLLPLLTLIFLEVVLGIDNIIFISIIVNKLPEKNRAVATNVGLLLAMVQRIILLFFASMLASLKTPFFRLDTSVLTIALNAQALILVLGGLFLLYKSATELYEKVERREHKSKLIEKKKVNSPASVLLQILFIDLVFSVDSILTAIGMVQEIGISQRGSLALMSSAVIITIFIMMFFATWLRRFSEKHPSIQLLGINFLLLIGLLLISEGLHSAGTVIFDREVEAIPKEYLYFAIIFSMFVEFINFRHRKKQSEENAA